MRRCRAACSGTTRTDTCPKPSPWSTAALPSGTNKHKETVVMSFTGGQGQVHKLLFCKRNILFNCLDYQFQSSKPYEDICRLFLQYDPVLNTQLGHTITGGVLGSSPRNILIIKHFISCNISQRKREREKRCARAARLTLVLSSRRPFQQLLVFLGQHLKLKLTDTFLTFPEVLCRFFSAFFFFDAFVVFLP